MGSGGIVMEQIFHTTKIHERVIKFISLCVGVGIQV